MTASDTSESIERRTRLAVLPQVKHWIVIPVVLALLTLLLGFSVKWSPSFASAQYQLDQLFSRHHNSVLNALALAINTALSPRGIIVILVLLFLFLMIVRRSPVNAVAVCTVAGLGWLSSEIFKLIVAEPRPDQSLLQNPLVVEHGTGSFPSGHTTFAVALAIAFYFFARNTRGVTPVVVVGILFAVVVALSRVYLGVHYPTDTLGSFLVAVTTIIFYAGLWNRYGMSVLRHVPFLDRFGPIPAADQPGIRRHGRRAGLDQPNS